MTVTSGWDAGRFHGMIGVELLDQSPLWEYQRSRQDSADDSPDPDGRIARRNFLRTDEYNDYLDPGAATCAPLAYLNGGTTIYGTRPDYGYDIANDEYIDGHYCGSKEAIAYGTDDLGPQVRELVQLHGLRPGDLAPNSSWMRTSAIRS